MLGGKEEDLKKKTRKKNITETISNVENNVMEMMQKMEQIYNGLPKLDCGSCGAPSCKAMAEDIVRGKAKETECIFKLKEKIQSVYDQLRTTF